jgi:hypothetical protein
MYEASEIRFALMSFSQRIGSKLSIFLVLQAQHRVTTMEHELESQKSQLAMYVAEQRRLLDERSRAQRIILR